MAERPSPPTPPRTPTTSAAPPSTTIGGTPPGCSPHASGPGEPAAFLAEARRVAGELVVVDSALRPGVVPDGWQERTLNDSSRHRVFKRYLTADGLAGEIGGEPLLDGRWFVGARA